MVGCDDEAMKDVIDIEMLKNKLAALPDFVLRKLAAIVVDFERESADSERSAEFEVCPKCGKVHPSLVRGGRTKGGKQMYRCKECGSRFVVDTEGLTFHSRLSREQWSEAVGCALGGCTLDETARRCGVAHSTAFKMRHKIMSFLEKDEDSIVVGDEVELDEKYLRESHKGKKVEGLEPHKRGTPASKRGVSDEQVCLLTAVQRGGCSFLRSYNMGRPTSDEVMRLEPHIREGAYLWTDRLGSYGKLAEKLGSRRVEVSSHSEYDKVNHLNNVNSFHSLVQKWYTDMRGVATKYVNRYAALMNLRWMLRGLEGGEALMKARKRINAVGSQMVLGWNQMDSSRLFLGGRTA